MKPITKEQQKHIAELIQSIYAKAQQFNNPVADTIGFFLGYFPGIIIASGMKSISWIAQTLINPITGFLVEGIVKLDLKMILAKVETNALKETFLKSKAHMTPEDFRNLNPAAYKELLGLLQPIIDQVKKDATERALNEMHRDIDLGKDYVFLVIFSFFIASLINHYVTRPITNKLFSSGIPSLHNLSKDTPFDEESAQQLISELEKIDTSLTNKLRYEKYITRTIFAATLILQAWDLWCADTRIPILTRTFLSIVNFFYVGFGLPHVLGNAVMLPALEHTISDAVKLATDLASNPTKRLNQHLEQTEKAFQLLIEKLGCFNFQLIKKDSFDKSFITLTIAKRYGNFYQRNNALEYLLFLFNNHSLQPQKIGQDTIRIPAAELPDAKTKKIAHQFKRFEERQEQNQKALQEFKGALQQFNLPSYLFLPDDMDVDYAIDSMKLPSIRNINIRMQLPENSDDDLRQLFIDYFPGTIFRVTTLENHSFLIKVDGCPKPINTTLPLPTKSIAGPANTHSSFREDTWTQVTSSIRKRKPAKGRAGNALEPEKLRAEAPKIQPEIQWPRLFQKLPGIHYDNLEHSESRGSNWSAFFTAPHEHFNNDAEYNAFKDSARGFAFREQNAQGIKTLDNPILIRGTWYTHEVKRLGSAGQIRVFGHHEAVATNAGNRNVIVFDHVDLTAHN
jgi:hypothetical protein